MTIHIPVKPPLIVALGGPVSAAIRAMRADEPATDYARIRELRRAIADRIEADIALLDALDLFADETEGRVYLLGVSVDDEDGGDAEGMTDDSGLGDADGLAEQVTGWHLHGGSVA